MASAAFGDFFVDFILTAAVGGLIGVEREHRAEGSAAIAGVRTFPLIAIAGFLVALLAQETGSPFVVAAGIAGAFALAIMLVITRQAVGFVGFTTPAVTIVTFLVGLLFGFDHRLEGVIVGVAATFLLLTKQRLHRFAQYLDEAEILSALQFITVAVILLPLTATLQAPVLGQTWLGRGQLVDPFVILTVVVFVSGISFASLIVMRQVGPRRGLPFSGLLGGLVNSEATTAGLAQRARDEPELVGPAVVGALLASATMLVRNLAIAAFADPSFSLVLRLVPFVIPVFLIGLALAWTSSPGVAQPIPGVRVKNPFAVLPALQFAALFAAVSIVAKLAQTQFGAAGVYITALGGFVSAGAVVASLGGLVATQQVTAGVAVITSVLAMAASVLGKLFILRAVDERTFRKARVPFLVLSAAAVVAALAALQFA